MKAATLGIGGLLFLDFISIHAAREGGDKTEYGFNQLGTISIHAAREGGDHHIVPLMADFNISIHAAREGGDPHTLIDCRAPRGFQSTPPVKAATPPCGQRGSVLPISIHAAREGGDQQ